MKIHLAESKSIIRVSEGFDESCVLYLSDESFKAIKEKKLSVKVNKVGRKKSIHNISVKISAVRGSIEVSVGNDGSSLVFSDNVVGKYDVRVWRKSEVFIGEETTSSGVKIVCDNSSFVCGCDCMFSDDVLIQTNDQHGIVDLSLGVIVNSAYSKTELGNHVWLGRRSTLMAGSFVESGSVVGAASLVTGHVPKNCIVAGVPARVIKENHTWSRSPIKLDRYSRENKQ